MTNVVAIIPARGGSQGIPLKNLKEIDGDPLVGIAANHATEAEKIDRTIVNSDHEDIRAAGRDYGAEVMDRPDRFAHDDTVQEVDRLLQWCIEQIEADGGEVDVLVLLYPTAPLRTVPTIDEAVELVVDGEYDSALSLYEDDSYLWERHEDDSVSPTNYDPAKRGPRQKEDWNQWVENKAVYAVERDVLMETGCRIGDNVGYVEMPAWRSIDVDRPHDLELARVLYTNELTGE
jgi:CMP-N,N'-diacetyllegionaminic acid synthase